MPDNVQVSAHALLADAVLDSAQVSAHALLVDATLDNARVSALGLLADVDYQVAVVSAHAALVDAEHYHYGRVAAHAVLVDAVAAPERPDLDAISTCVGDIYDGVSAAMTNMRALVEAGTATSRALRGLEATLTGYREDIRECRATLDATDVTDALLYDDAAAQIRLWQWERRTRWRLVGLDARLRQALDILRELLEGRVGRTYAVRTGDTLQSIAASELGDWRQWRRIAEVNGIEPGPLTVGTVLTIPEQR